MVIFTLFFIYVFYFNYNVYISFDLEETLLNMWGKKLEIKMK